MAKVTVTFEDVDHGVQVKVESEPAFPGPAASEEAKAALTQAQMMGIRMTELLTEELSQEDHIQHIHGPGCGCDDEEI